MESRDKAPGTVATMHIGKLSLVDLAGSERYCVQPANDVFLAFPPRSRPASDTLSCPSKKGVGELLRRTFRLPRPVLAGRRALSLSPKFRRLTTAAPPPRN